MGFLDDGLGWRSLVMLGSKGLDPGVTRAFRFWEMVSSIAPRDTRRKSRELLMSVSLRIVS